MLNVGPLELLVVLAVALVVVGPERLPELARSVGRALRQFREVQDEVRDMVSLGADDEVRQAAAEFKKASGRVKRATDVKGALRQVEREVADESGRPRATPPATPAPAGPDDRDGSPPDPSTDDPPPQP